jgi:hypothetical protein
MPREEMPSYGLSSRFPLPLNEVLAIAMDISETSRELFHKLGQSNSRQAKRPYFQSGKVSV